jgi:hypothetical protein
VFSRGEKPGGNIDFNRVKARERGDTTRLLGKRGTNRKIVGENWQNLKYQISNA